MPYTRSVRSHKYRCSWGSFVLFLLESRGWSQADLGERLGMAQGQVSNYINGRSKPPLGELEGWAKALKLNVSERERLTWLALEPWTPAPVWAKIRELEALLAEMEGSTAAMAGEVAHLRLQRYNALGKPPTAH
jgi:transcriptional regulator with XRE-family HTH domain